MKIVFNEETRTFSLFNIFKRSGRDSNVIENILAFLENSDNYEEKYTDYDESIEDILQNNIDDGLIPFHPNDKWYDRNDVLNDYLSDSDKKLYKSVLSKLDSYFNDHKSYLLSKSLIEDNGNSRIYKIKPGYYIEARNSKYMLIPLDKVVSDICGNKFNIPEDTIFRELRNDDYILSNLEND